jgi:hypothetical protein
MAPCLKDAAARLNGAPSPGGFLVRALIFHRNSAAGRPFAESMGRRSICAQRVDLPSFRSPLICRCTRRLTFENGYSNPAPESGDKFVKTVD